jgi:glycosyltransferase involved in cell wall biosynthesis
MQKPARTLLNVGLYERSNQKSCLENELEEHGYSSDFYLLGTESTIALVTKSFLIPKRLSNYDFIITSEYFSSFGISLRLLLTRSKTKHITIGLNQSRRLLKTGFRCINRYIDYAFQRTDLVVVHSRAEMTLFKKIHNILPDRFYFSLWGYDLPKSTATRFSRWPKPYVCLIGRNNRDIDTFLNAIDGMKIDAIIITSRQQTPTVGLPPNAHLFFDLPLNETLDCIKNALANLILLKSADRGAGHITAVSAMFLGVPQIVSDVDVIKDYLIDGVSAITVRLRDADATRLAIERLIRDPVFAAWLCTNARDYAHRWLTNKQVVERIVFALNKLAQGQELATVDPEWLMAYQKVASKAQ